MQTILFFDLDLTLIRNRFSQKVFRPLLEEIAAHSQVSVAELGIEMHKEDKYRQEHKPNDAATMDWNDIVATIAAEHAVKLSDSVDRRWAKLAKIEDIDILDDAPSVLQSLKNGNRKLVLATKGLSKYQNPILDVTGLRPYFDDILTPDIVGYLKTSPQYFDKYKKQEAVFIQIGDHFHDDVICAKRNGFYSIMRAPIPDLAIYDAFDRPHKLDDFLDKIPSYPDEGSPIRPDAVVLSLQEVPELVQRIEQNQNRQTNL